MEAATWTFGPDAIGSARGGRVTGGATVASSTGLVAGGVLWGRLPKRNGSAAAAVRTSGIVRLAGLMLAAASAWVLGHGMWMRVIDWCTS